MSVLTAELRQTAPLGATLTNGGVNFSVFSKHATRIELLLFDDARDRGRPASSRSTRDDTGPITTGTRSCRISRQVRSTPTAPMDRSLRSADCGSIARKCCSTRTASRCRCRPRYDRDAAQAAG